MFGARLLRRSPGFAAVAVLSLGLGIGGATAVFSLVNAIVLRTLPVPDPQQLYQAQSRRRRTAITASSSPAPTLRARARRWLVARAAASCSRRPSVAGMQLQPDGESDRRARQRAARVGRVLHARCGRQPQLGRLLAPSDNTHRRRASRRRDERRLLAPRASARRPTRSAGQLAINGTSFTIVGVTAAALLRHDAGAARAGRVGAAT